MNDLALLHRAILTRPEDDVVRLAYADALDERGAPGDAERAEFVRVQIELERRPFGWGLCGPGEKHTPACAGDRDRLRACNAHGHRGDRLRVRELELFKEPRRYVNWMPSFLHTGSGVGVRIREATTVEITGNGFASVEFARGFVSSLTATADAFFHHADDLLWHPEQTITERRYSTDPNCRTCGGSGTVGFGWTEDCGCAKMIVIRGARPVPATAQPVTRVVLTTLPAGEDRWEALGRKYNFDWMPTEGPDRAATRRFVATYFPQEWPGVEFVLPSSSLTESPAFAEPEPPSAVVELPREGWRVERRPTLAPSGPFTSVPWWGVPDALRFSLSIRLYLNADSYLSFTHGMTLTDVSGEDRHGRRYTFAQVVVTNYVDHYSMTVRPVDVEAESVGGYTVSD